MRWRDELEKPAHFRKALNCILNFREGSIEALIISKRLLSCPMDDRTDTNFIAQLKMHF